MEMMHFFWAPKYDANTSTYVFAAPLADGAVPMIHLDDLGEYARWIFDHADQSAGKDLRVATQHVHFNEVAEAFTKVTGNKAIYQDIPLEAWFDSFVKDGASSAYQVDASEAGVLTFRESFTGWWNCYRHSGGEDPFISIDYDLLDKVYSKLQQIPMLCSLLTLFYAQTLPNRVRSIEEWMRKVGYTGLEAKAVLKEREDGAGRERFKDY